MASLTDPQLDAFIAAIGSKGAYQARRDASAALESADLDAAQTRAIFDAATREHEDNSEFFGAQQSLLGVFWKKPAKEHIALVIDLRAADPRRQADRREWPCAVPDPFRCRTRAEAACSVVRRHPRVCRREAPRAVQAFRVRAPPPVPASVSNAGRTGRGADGPLARFPTEMARAPREILLLAKRPVRVSGRPHSAYFYRFRHPEFNDGKWYVGMAGPYPVDGEPTLFASGTFSRFSVFESKSLDEHIAEYLK